MHLSSRPSWKLNVSSPLKSARSGDRAYSTPDFPRNIVGRVPSRGASPCFFDGLLTGCLLLLHAASFFQPVKIGRRRGRERSAYRAIDRRTDRAVRAADDPVMRFHVAVAE